MQQHFLRRHAYIIHASLVEKPAKPEELWPIGEDEARAAETAENFRERMLRLTEEVLKKEREKGTVFAQA